MKKHRFDSTVERLDTGLKMHVIPVPEDVSEQLPKSHRVIVKIGTLEIRRALLARKMGCPYFSLSKDSLNELGLREGSSLAVELWADPEPDRLDLAPEFVEALSLDKKATTRWKTFTLGKKRSLNYYVESAKREDTRIKRAIELVGKIRDRQLNGD